MIVWRQMVVLLVILYAYSGCCQVRDLDLDKAYDVVKALIAYAKQKDKKLPNQFVSAVLMSPDEIKNFCSLKKFEGRLGLYTNKNGGKTHGEQRLLEDDLENFKYNYRKSKGYVKNQTAILVVFSTYIPCHRVDTGSKHETNCSLRLRNRINKEGGSLELFVAFIGVYSRTVERGTRVDYTDLNKALQYLSGTSHICLTYFTSKTLKNLYSPETTLKTLSNFKLTSCIDNNPVDIWRLQSRYPKNHPNQTAQETLYRCLMVFVAPCEHINKTGNAIRIVAFAVNYAFMSCIQESDPNNDSFSCRNEGGPLTGSADKKSSGNRNKLYNCLSSKWLDSLKKYKSNNCQGDPKKNVRMCLRQAVQSLSMGSPRRHMDYTKPEWQSEQGTWNVKLGYDIKGFKGFKRSPSCPRPLYKPEFLCTV